MLWPPTGMPRYVTSSHSSRRARSRQKGTAKRQHSRARLENVSGEPMSVGWASIFRESRQSEQWPWCGLTGSARARISENFFFLVLMRSRLGLAMGCGLQGGSVEAQRAEEGLSLGRCGSAAAETEGKRAQSQAAGRKSGGSVVAASQGLRPEQARASCGWRGDFAGRCQRSPRWRRTGHAVPNVIRRSLIAAPALISRSAVAARRAIGRVGGAAGATPGRR